jgi:hypothetical protein
MFLRTNLESHNTKMHIEIERNMHISLFYAQNLESYNSKMHLHIERNMHISLEHQK